jgi:hypothetical protein
MRHGWLIVAGLVVMTGGQAWAQGTEAAPDPEKRVSPTPTWHWTERPGRDPRTVPSGARANWRDRVTPPSYIAPEQGVRPGYVTEPGDLQRPGVSATCRQFWATANPAFTVDSRGAEWQTTWEAFSAQCQAPPR